MQNQKKIQFISSELLKWFSQNQRPLPWRNTTDAYRIWLSEIILQQTRVQQGLPYYMRFIEHFPTIQSMAQADEQEVLQLWQGLGYYSRARNMHHTARQVVAHFGGVFPDNHKDMLSLKGIGNYTAAAILSFAYNKPFAVLDGNVYRLIARLYGIDMPINAKGAEALFMEKVTQLLDVGQPGAFNQAIMEFGSMHCLPVNPHCKSCPFQSQCVAFAEGSVKELPRKLPKKPVKDRYFHYLYIYTSAGLYLKRRPAGDIWQALYDLPLLESHSDTLPDIGDLPEWQNIRLLKKTRHLLTHQRLHISFYEGFQDIASKIPKNPNTFYIFVPYNELTKYPLPRPIEMFLKERLGSLKVKSLEVRS